MDRFVKCSALRNRICTDGFPAVPMCSHTELATGSLYGRLPCCDENWTARLFPETGAPSMEQVERSRRRAADNL